ncbi:aspartate-semialdehyde dehydrogenase [Candidatus Uhrbacteria bacterium]|nr:aspartate-semialdehyde dehydrogenase [Candidatus Uhrbacteria bacterium]
MANRKKKIPVGILGATGMVGQRYIQLLENHPLFEVAFVAASPRSAGISYADAVAGRWVMDTPIPVVAASLTVYEATDVVAAADRCRFVFSCLEMDTKEQIQELERAYAAAGLPVVSNASAHRWTSNVPMLIPEVNAEHLSIIPAQQKHYGWKSGFIVTKPNCSLQSYVTPLHALMRAGYSIDRVMVTTLQAISGAGYPGVASLDIIDNVVPFINGEEEKTEQEPMKIFGSIDDGHCVPRTDITISAQCTRVPVIDGHTACVNIGFAGKKPTPEEIKEIWSSFRAKPQELDLPSAPRQPIIYREEENHPQPRKDRNNEKGMAVTVGRLRPCPVFDYKFIALSHNTIRGAAGGGILNAELLVAEKFIR